jgi:CheY-like chemotaxis protein
MARSVLVVDDSASFRSAASALLEARGYDVAGVAEDGAAGLEAAERLQPDAVLVDVSLPDMDGREVAAELARGRPKPTVVLVSTFGGAPPGGDAHPYLRKADLPSRRLLDLLGAPESGS